jgi:hypothetical protein
MPCPFCEHSQAMLTINRHSTDPAGIFGVSSEGFSEELMVLQLNVGETQRGAVQYPIFWRDDKSPIFWMTMFSNSSCVSGLFLWSQLCPSSFRRHTYGRKRWWNSEALRNNDRVCHGYAGNRLDYRDRRRSILLVFVHDLEYFGMVAHDLSFAFDA